MIKGATGSYPSPSFYSLALLMSAQLAAPCLAPSTASWSIAASRRSTVCLSSGSHTSSHGPVRMQCHQKNALAVALYLQNSKKVENVIYPGEVA